MVVDPKITNAELVDLWRILPRTLNWLGRTVILQIGEQPEAGAPYVYDLAAIDREHIERLHPKYTSFPSTAELLAIQRESMFPALMTIEEVARETGRTTGAIYARIRTGGLPATKIADRWLIPQPASRALTASYSLKGAVSFELAGQIIGISASHMRDISAGYKPTVERAERRIACLDAASFLKLLNTSVFNITPEDWCVLRKLHNYEPLLTAPEARKMCSQFRKFLAVEAHLLTPGGGRQRQLRIPRHLIAQWADDHPPIIRRQW